MIPHFFQEEGKRMMYRKAHVRFQQSNVDYRLYLRVLAIACAVLLALCIVLGGWAIRNANYREKTQTQISQRMYGAAASAVDEVNRIGSIVTSNANARLSRVRQYIYFLEQLNAMSISLAGGEGGRIVPDDAFTALYSDLDNYESLLQQSTTTTLNARTTLLTHLQALQTYLEQ